VFKNQVGRRAYFDIRKCSELPSALQRCIGDKKKSLRFSLAKAVNIRPCCVKEKVKYAGDKVTFLILAVIMRLYLGET